MINRELLETVKNTEKTVTAPVLWNTYGIRLSHIFEIPSTSNEKLSISVEMLGISNQKF